MFLSSHLDAELARALGPDRDVAVDAQAPLLHVHVADAELADRLAEQLRPLARLRGAAMSGSVTISTSGVPPRLKSTSEAPEPWMRPVSPMWISFAASSSRWARCDADPGEAAADGNGLVELADLVALRQVGVEVVLAGELVARRHLALQRRGDHAARSGSPAR